MAFSLKRIKVILPVNIRSEMKSLFALILGMGTSSYVFKLTGWSYNPFAQPFVFWKTAVRYGIPVLAILMWFSILHVLSIWIRKRFGRKQ